MRYGKRTYGGARLMLVIPTALPAKMRGRVVELRGLYTKPESRGVGDAINLMLATTTEADMGGYFLFLAVEPAAGTDRQRLLNLYLRHGFLPIQADPLLMTRPCVSARAAVAADKEARAMH